MNFCINLTNFLHQFLETRTLDITFMGRDRELKLLAPFNVSFTVPLSEKD